MPVCEAEAPARRARLGGLYVIVGGPDPVARAEAALDGGARVVQVRLKNAPAGEILAVTRRIVTLAAGRALVIVNDRADLALLAGADGVHLGDDDLPPAEARKLLGPDLLIGRTTRTLDEARAALAAGADHVGYGRMFGTRSKVIDAAPRGLAALRALSAALPAPVVAIGGVGLSTVAEVARAGAACAAVIEAVFGAPHPRDAAATLAAAFEAGRLARARETTP
ncbi:MAG: thiamine phosphate synthase [Anaeromyxobacter sp.]